MLDDGSTDNTREIIKTKYKNKVRYLYQENKGVPAVRNKGIRESNGEYLVLLDAHDYLTPSSLEDKIAISEFKEDVGWVYSIWQYVDTKGNILESVFAKAPFAFKRKLRGNIFREMLCGTLISTCVVLIRKKCAEEVGGFDERLKAFQDFDLWLRVSYRYSVEYINKVLVFVTIHEGSISSKQPPYPARAIINRKLE